MNDKEILDRLWEEYSETPFASLMMQRKLDLRPQEDTATRKLLGDMSDSGEVRSGYRIKRVASTVYKMTQAQPSDSDTVKGKLLIDPEESLTGANTASFHEQSPENEPFAPKWTAHDYPNDKGEPKQLLDWKPPRLDVFAVSDTEKDALHAIKDAFQPIAPYKDNTQGKGLEAHAIATETLVEITAPVPQGYIAFLENTAERCTSPTTKHSQDGMNRAEAWVQRVDTPARMFQRLTDGYGISLMFGERFHQFIRNSHNWRGVSGMMLDIDVFKDDDHPDAPEPCASQAELLDRFPLIPRICSYLIPSASSLYEGRPFKARALVLFPEPVTDQRIYRAFGDILLQEIDCIPANVTKNPVAVGFGNTHNAPQAYTNPRPDTQWIQDTLSHATESVLQEASESKARQAGASRDNGKRNGTGGIEGENISEFIWNCDAITEMVKKGWLTKGTGNEYRWHQASSDRSCEIYDDGGTIKIFSGTMTSASPGHATEPVQSHRFYLYQLKGLDLSKDADKAKCREYLFSIGYGHDPKAVTLSHKPVKLKPRSDIELLTQPIERARESLRDAFDTDLKMIGFRADTGIGKTEEVINLYTLKEIGGFFSTPTSILAKEVESRLRYADCDVFRWRGLHSEQDGEFPRQKPCMFPDEYQAYAESGRNAYKMLCETCEYLKLCREEGYQSQEQRASWAQVTVAAHKDLLFNPAFRSTAERLLPKHEDDLIAVDEFDVFESFIECEVTQERLEYLAQTWSHHTNSERPHALGEFAIELLVYCLTSRALYNDLSRLVTANTESHKTEQAIHKALASYRIGDYVHTRDEAHERSEDRAQTAEYINALPKIETETWNVLCQLKAFFEIYTHPEGAPIAWKNNTLTFYLPPLPFYTKAKVICMSATLNENFFSTAFAIRDVKRGDVGFINADDTDWHPEAKVFQLRTNRNPRHTLLVREQNDTGAWRYTGFSDTGQRFFDAILESVSANPDLHHALISYKWVVETHATALEAQGIITAHFGNLVGLDSHFNRDTDDPIVLHILGSPETPPDITAHRFNLLYGGQGTIPTLDRDIATGEYKDDTVREVYEAGVKAELMQAIGRAGLVKNPSTVIVWTSHELPSVSHRDQTDLFDETDWLNALGNLEALPDTIRAREAREQTAAQATHAGDARSVAQARGVTDRHARRLTQKTREQAKAERNAEIIRLHKEGDSQREIHRKMTGTGYKVSQGVISSFLSVPGNGHGQGTTFLEDVRFRARLREADKKGIDNELSEPVFKPHPDTIKAWNFQWRAALVDRLRNVKGEIRKSGWIVSRARTIEGDTVSDWDPLPPVAFVGSEVEAHPE